MRVSVTPTAGEAGASDYSWEVPSSVISRHHVPRSQPLQNQCVALRGFRISLREDLMGRLAERPKANVDCIAASRPRDFVKGSAWGRLMSQEGGLFATVLRFFGGSGGGQSRNDLGSPSNTASPDRDASLDRLTYDVSIKTMLSYGVFTYHKLLSGVLSFRCCE